MKRSLSLVFAILLILTLFAGCGDKKEDTGETTAAGTGADDTTAAPAINGTLFETDNFSVIVPDGWEKMDVDGGFQLYKMSGEIIEIHFRGFNQGETQAKLQVESSAKGLNGTTPVEEEFLGKTFWKTVYTANSVSQVFYACMVDGAFRDGAKQDGVMLSVKYGGPGYDTNPEFMNILNTVVWK